jgi:hypothetical protein
MNPEVNTAIRKAEVEQELWKFFTVYRKQLADCEANQNMLEAALEDQLLPITFENLSTFWESLTPQQKSVYAGPLTTGEVKPRKAATTVVDAAAVLEKMGGVLPEEYTRRRILKMGRDEYKELIKKYGQEIVVNRVNGIE